MSEKNPRKRPCRIDLHITIDERNDIRSKSDVAGLSVSEYIRRLCNGHSIEAAPSQDLKDLIWEVRRVGNNLNQLIRRFNTLGIEPGEELVRCVKDIEEIKKIIESGWQSGKGDEDGSNSSMAHRQSSG
ncbi:MAG: plasmid mobilization relaxosome protein MobC [Saccharofermentans sp.]|nr:plasmid mobilization relaxosome protein MobC [Saccharofermentans sp.]